MSESSEVVGVISKIKKVTVEVPVSYFHCGSPRCNKRHKSEDTASRCQLRRQPPAERAEASFQRGERIVALRDSGMTFKAIGEVVGRLDNASIPISGTGALLLYEKHMRRHITPYIAEHMNDEQARRIHL